MTSQVDDFDGLESIPKISAWLKPTDYLALSSEYRRHLNTQAPGTGLWHRQTNEYRQWRDSEDCGSLWVKGVPGAGKSVVAASMIDLLRGPQQFPVLFFFFRQIVAANHTPRSLVKDWLDQLLPHSLQVRGSLSLLLKEDVVENCSDDHLWHILLDGLASVPVVYCVADALDEMDSGNAAFLSRLNELAAFRPQSVKLLLTSRPKQYLQSALKNAHTVHVSLEKDLVESDIAAFVWYRLTQPGAKRLLEDQKHTLKATICAQSRGLFLYARLILDQVLEDLENAPQIDTVDLIKTLPVGLTEMYNDILYKQRILLGIETDIQVFLLQCVTHCARPLRLNELASALQYWSHGKLTQPDCKALARGACGPLLQILEDETVQVIHHSLTEFLWDDRRSDLQSRTEFPVIGHNGEHKFLLLFCLRYLRCAFAEQLPQDQDLLVDDYKRNQKHDNEDGPAKEKQEASAKNFSFDYQQACLEHTFLEYSVSSWLYHASQHNATDQETLNVFEDFLNPDHRDYQVWLWLHWGFWRHDSPGRHSACALHIAAFGGLTEFAEYLLATGMHVDQCDTDGRTALHWASSEGHHRNVAALLQHGAKADPEDVRGLKPLHEAAKKNHSHVARLLLGAGVSMRTPKTKDDYQGPRFTSTARRSTMGKTPLQYACKNGNTASVCEMLVYMDQRDVDEALCLAISNNRLETVRALFEANPSANPTLDQEPALFTALRYLQEDTVRELLARGANTSVGYEYEKPLSAPAASVAPQLLPIHCLLEFYNYTHVNRLRVDRFRKILQLLMDANVNIEAKDSTGSTALYKAIVSRLARVEKIEIVQMLLDCGASISSVDRGGSSVLEGAIAECGDPSVLRMLLDHSPIAVDQHIGRSLLAIAVFSRDYMCDFAKELGVCIELLVQHGAECDLGTLSAAFGDERCNMDVLRLLLASSQIGAQQKGHLFHCIQGRSRDPKPFIELLLEQGADIETRDREGRTPFLSQVRTWSVALALLDYGARSNVVDAAGQNALWTCHRMTGLTWDRLIELGLDPLQARYDGCSLLHHAARNFGGGETGVSDMKALMDLGLDVNRQDQNGSPPLHVGGDFHNNIGSCVLPSLLSVLREGNQPLCIDIQDNNGFTALHLASMHDAQDVKRLLEAGADAHILTNDNENALHIACRSGRSDVVGLLIEHSKALMASENIRGETPLHLACQAGRPESVYYLLKTDRSLNTKDAQGNTPLHSCALFSGKMKWKGLDQKDSEAGSTSNVTMKPLQLNVDGAETELEALYDALTGDNIRPMAIESGSDAVRGAAIVKMLLTHGADPLAENRDGHTPLELAILWGNWSMAEMLSAPGLGKPLTTGAAAKLAQLNRIDWNFRRPILELLEKDVNMDELLLYPPKYWKVLTAANLRDMVLKRQGEPEIHRGPYSLIRHLASEGLTEPLEVLESACKLYDDAEWLQKHQSKERLDPNELQPPLQAACGLSGSMPMIELLVTRCGVDVNAHHLVYSHDRNETNSDLLLGNTALHCLAVGWRWWQIGAIRWLVSQGADVNARNDIGQTPLHIASYGKRLRPCHGMVPWGFWANHCLRALLELGADPNAVDNKELACLSAAGGSPDSILDLLKWGASMGTGTGHALFQAIDCGDVEAAAILLDHGASIDRVDTCATCQRLCSLSNRLRSPLYAAATEGDFRLPCTNTGSMTKLLLQRGADWKARLNDSETLVHYVFETARGSILEVFLSFPGIDYNLIDQRGKTVLQAACSWQASSSGCEIQIQGSQPILPAMAMLDLGADTEKVDQDGRSALHHLLDNRHLTTRPVLTFLKRPECQRLIVRKDDHGTSPLHIALRQWRIECCNFLLANGAHLLGVDGRGWTALHYLLDGLALDPMHCSTKAVLNKDGTEEAPEFAGNALELWQGYLNLGGDIDAKNQEGDTALLMYLASPMTYDVYSSEDPSCHTDTFSILFSTADIFTRNNDGDTALHVIAKRKASKLPRLKSYAKQVQDADQIHDAGLFKLLMSKGLDPLAEDGKGRSALDVAATCGKVKILEMFRR